jgi:hypothetical protein
MKKPPARVIVRPSIRVIGRLGVCAILLCLFATLSCATKPQILRGTVRVYGSEPHTYAGIVAGGKVYAVYPPEKEAEIRRLQGQDIEFTVQFLDKPKGYGSLFLVDGCITPVSWKLAE